MTERSEQINELAAALVAAQGKFSVIPKTSLNPFFKSKYADLADVVRTAAPVLVEHGLAVSQFLGVDEHGDTLTTWLIHESGQFIAESMRLHLAKPDAQGQGSATTYARRYAYMAALGLVADDDDDGNKASEPRRPGPRSQPPQHEVAVAGLLNEAQREKVLSAVGAAGGRLGMVLAAVGVESIETMTVADARRVRTYLDGLGKSDIPADMPASPELAAIEDDLFPEAAA